MKYGLDLEYFFQRMYFKKLFNYYKMNFGLYFQLYQLT